MDRCKTCKEKLNANWKFCPICGILAVNCREEKVKQIVNSPKIPTIDLNGIWRVYAVNGNEAERRDLVGLFEGEVKHIALWLAVHKIPYGWEFTFDPVKTVKVTENPKYIGMYDIPESELNTLYKVNIQLGIESGTWDIKDKSDLVEAYNRALMEPIPGYLGIENPDKRFYFEPCNYYACVTLVFDPDLEKKGDK